MKRAGQKLKVKAPSVYYLFVKGFYVAFLPVPTVDNVPHTCSARHLLWGNNRFIFEIRDQKEQSRRNILGNADKAALRPAGLGIPAAQKTAQVSSGRSEGVKHHKVKGQLSCPACASSKLLS